MKLVETPAEFENWFKQHGYKKSEIARILGVTRQTLYNLSHAKANEPAHRMIGKSSDKLDQLNSLPPMLSLSLFAIETLGPKYFGDSARVRKRSKRRV
jgi:transcriptional regulator with XRE-family HTH domain